MHVCVHLQINKDHKSNLNLNFVNAHVSDLMSKPGFATIFTVPTDMLNHLGNEPRSDQTVQMYRLSFPLVVRKWHKLVFWREIKTPAHYLSHLLPIFIGRGSSIGSVSASQAAVPQSILTSGTFFRGK